MATRMTSKGQVTIPKAVREACGLRPGKPVTVEASPDGVALIRPAVDPTTEDRRADILAAFQHWRDRGPPLETSVDAYMATIREPLP